MRDVRFTVSQYAKFYRTTQAAAAALGERSSDLKLRYRAARDKILRHVVEGHAFPDSATVHIERLKTAPANLDDLSEDLLRVALDDIRALARLGKVARWL